MVNMTKVKKVMIGAAMAAMTSAPALAATAIANDTLQGLPQVGLDIGNFMTNLAPGIGAFLIVLGVLGGVAGIVGAIVSRIKKKV